MAKGSGEVEEGKIFAFLGVFLTIIGFLIVLLAKKENKYAMYYAKQGLVLFIAYVAAWVVGMIMNLLPVIGNIIMTVLYVILAILWVVGWIYALSGERKPIPVIGQFADMIKV